MAIIIPIISYSYYSHIFFPNIHKILVELGSASVNAAASFYVYPFLNILFVHSLETDPALLKKQWWLTYLTLENSQSIPYMPPSTHIAEKFTPRKSCSNNSAFETAFTGHFKTWALRSHRKTVPRGSVKA